MSSSRRRRNKLPPPCDELGPDDGIDPRILFRNEHRRSRDDRKLAQLCAQALRALQFALTGSCRDPLLQQLDVVSVSPAPDAGRLCVVVAPFADDVAPGDLRVRLTAAHGLLRAAVAAGINRRKAPELVFEIAPGGEVTG